MGRRRAGQRDGKRVGVVEGWEEGGWDREMGRRWAVVEGGEGRGQRDGKKVGVVEGWEKEGGPEGGKEVGVTGGWEEGGRDRGMGRRWAW